MSSMGIHVPSPAEHNYHADHQVRRAEAAFKTIDPGDVLAVIDQRLVLAAINTCLDEALSRGED